MSTLVIAFGHRQIKQQIELHNKIILVTIFLIVTCYREKCIL